MKERVLTALICYTDQHPSKKTISVRLLKNAQMQGARNPEE